MSKEKLEEYENKIVMQEKSKLQKESENYLNQNCKRWESDSLSVDDIAIENYLAGAEPREKRIAELEKENEKLKTDYEVLSCSVCDFGELQDKLEEEQRKNNGLSDNLTKAKEIIKKMIEAIHIWDCKNLEEVEAEAEQFLKEIRK